MTLGYAVCTVLWLAFVGIVRGSIGDLNPSFRTCVGECVAKHGCPVRAGYYKWTTKPCFDCRYACMWSTVKLFQRFNRPVPQFYGKWPFSAISTEVGGFVILVQEPASTLFSLLNLCACLWLLNEIWVKMPDSRMRNIWMGYALVGSCCWICSINFHSRDFWFTEYLDYFAAGALIFYAFYTSLMLTLPSLKKPRMSSLVFGATVLLYARYVHALFSRPTFDYGYNMFCCVSLSMATVAVYILWILREWYNGAYRQSLSTLLTIIMIGLGAALFEVFDFPPVLYWSIDAHSLFHLATTPTPILMGRFAVAEAEHERQLLARRSKFEKDV